MSDNDASVTMAQQERVQEEQVALENLGVEEIYVSSVEDSLGTADFDIDKVRFNLARDSLVHLFWFIVAMVIVRAMPGMASNADFLSIFTVYTPETACSNLYVQSVSANTSSKQTCNE